MLETVALLGLIFVAVAAMNAVPAFMPATWMVLAFCYTQGDFPLLPLTVGGAIASGVGRMILAKSVRRTGFRGRSGTGEDLAHVRQLFERRPIAVASSLCAYAALVPLPNSQVFMAAGLLRLDLRAAFAGFVAGRIVADTFWVWTSGQVAAGVDDLFGAAFRTPWGIFVQAAGLAMAVAIFRVPWAHWLARRIEGRRHPL